MTMMHRNQDRGRPHGGRMPQKRNTFQKPPAPIIPRPKRDEVRALIFGGVSEIGKNMFAIEYNDTIVLLECGTMFGESTTPGINKIMPNIQYLKNKRHNIKAIVVTEAAMTHCGAVEHTAPEIGSPPIFVRTLTKAIIENRNKLMRRPPSLTFHEIEKEETVKLSEDMTLHFFGISKKTPSTLGVLIETGSGNIVYTGNIQIDNKKGIVRAEEDERFAMCREKDVLLSLSDSVSAERPGFAISDETVAKNIAQMLQETPYRTLMPLFPSQIQRNSIVLTEALKLGKKIYVQGKQLMQNLETAIEVGLLTIPKEALIPIEEMDEDDELKKVLVVFTGAENEEYETLEEISQKNYRYLSIIKDDTVIFPDPMIATNARNVQNLKDRLSRLGAIIRVFNTSDVKASGHASKDELKWMQQRINPKYFIPVQGYHYMLTAHTHILRDIGVSKDSCIIPENGSVIDISADGTTIRKHKQKMETIPLSVDGHTLAPIQEVVIQDRKTLSQDGIFIVIVFIDQKRLVLKKSPDIISRGFIFLKESQDLIAQTRVAIKKAAEKKAQEMGKVEIDDMKKAIQKEVRNFLVNETNKKPIVVPVIFT